MLPETSYCSECKKGATTIVIPTTHIEKTEYLYGTIPLEQLQGEIVYLQKRIDWLEEHKILILGKDTTATTYKHVTDILNAQKHFQSMIDEIKVYL